MNESSTTLSEPLDDSDTTESPDDHSFDVKQAFEQHSLSAETFDPGNEGHKEILLRVFREGLRARIPTRRVTGRISGYLGGRMSAGDIASLGNQEGASTLLSESQRKELEYLQVIAHRELVNIVSLREMPDYGRDVIRRIVTLLVDGCQIDQRTEFRKTFKTANEIMKQGFGDDPIELSLDDDAKSPIPHHLRRLVHSSEELGKHLVRTRQQNVRLETEILDIAKSLEQTVEAMSTLVREKLSGTSDPEQKADE